MQQGQARESAKKASPHRLSSLVGMLIAAGVLSRRSRVTHRDQVNHSSTGPEARARSSELGLSRQRTEAIANALLMIDYAATHGRRLSQDDVEAVLEISRKLDAPSGPTAKEEARFWQAAAQISSMLTPSTVASIRERNHFLAITSERTPGSILKRVANLVISYFVVFVLIIIFCLAVHAHYVWLGQLRAEATDSIQRFDGARSALFAAIGSQAQEQTKLEPGALAAINQNLSIACNALDNWRTTTSTLAEAMWNSDLVRDISDIQVENQNAEFKLCGDFDANMPIRDLATELHQLRVVDLPTQKALQRSGHYREAIGQFLLPLLYGLLGASASFARSLSTALRDVSYSPSFWVDSFFLIPLGALAGATVGIVIAPDALGTGWGVTTLGFSFLLGYSVDGFFARLDSMIRGLANASATRSEVATDNAVVVSRPDAPVANGGNRPRPAGSTTDGPAPSTSGAADQKESPV